MQPAKRMRGWLIVSACIAAISLNPACNEGEGAPREIPPPPTTLTIITPHSATIREAFERGFGDWRRQQDGPPVQIEWIVRGTPQCVTYVRSAFSGGSERPPDLMFGGGISDHQALAASGFCRTPDLQDVIKDVPDQVRGLPSRDPEGRWFATGLSSFGIVYNEKQCGLRGIDAPANWADLADPRYFGWLAIADPAGSGSHRQSMMLILQAQGWEEGFSTLIRILGNTRALAPSSGEVLDNVRSGNCLAGFAVNFDGQAIAEETGGGVRYVNPPGATAATPDVCSVLKSAVDAELAADFVRFCLSEQGQTIWGVRAEHRDTGGRDLYHYPIVPRIYTDYADKLAVNENPFAADFGVQVDLTKSGWQTFLLVPLVEAACGDRHVLLQQTWRKLIDAGLPADALAEFTRPPLDEDAASKAVEKMLESPEETERLIDEWSRVFESRYRAVQEMCGG